MITFLYKKIHFKDITLLFILFALLCGFIKKMVYVLIIVLLHELGHVLVCFILKYKVKSIDIYPFGGLSIIEKHLNDSFYHDIFLASGGIIIQFIIMILGYLHLINDPFFLELNYKILLFNIIPIIPLDGSKIVFEILNKFFSFYKSLNYYILISFIFIIIFIYYNFNNLVDCYVIIILFIQKTIELYKNKKTIFNKFILERKLYHLKFNKVKKDNKNLKDYQKDVKYYYQINNNVIDEYDYLNNYDII